MLNHGKSRCKPQTSNPKSQIKIVILHPDSKKENPLEATEYIQLKAFARMDGALLAVLWTASFACYVLGLSQPGLGMVAMVLAIITPFFVARRLKKFRDEGREGVISFRRAWAYTLLSFFYASLLFAIVQFVYFSYLDHGYFFGTLSKSMMAPENVQALGKDMMNMVVESLQAASKMRPIDLSLNIMMSNLFIGLIASIPIAAVMKREAKIQL